MSICACFQPKPIECTDDIHAVTPTARASTTNGSAVPSPHEGKAEAVPVPVPAPEPEPEPEPVEEEPEKNPVHRGISDNVIWNCPMAKHSHGELSFAVAQGNTMMEDHADVVCSTSSTYVGVFDGHGGFQHSEFLKHNMHDIIKGVAESAGGLSADVFTEAFQAADTKLLQLVRENWKIQPAFASAGSCALVGVVEGSTLYVACVGDSRAVLGTTASNWSGSIPLSGLLPLGRPHVRPLEMSVEHNASREDVREEVLRRCPDDPTILLDKGGLWRVKGIIQVTRSLGDFYLKEQEFQCPPLYTKFRLPEPLKHPCLINTPSITTHQLTDKDKFLILATDGLWDVMSNQEAVDIVHHYPRPGIARRLVKLALIRSAKKRKLTYKDLSAMRPGRRRELHDDTTCVVVFFDHHTPRARALAPITLKSFQPLEAPPEEEQAELAAEEDVPDDFEFGAGLHAHTI